MRIRISIISLLLLFCLTACSSGLKIIHTGQDKPWAGPYVSGMNGVENLTFDGAGNMFVTGLDGMIYRVVPTDDPFRGKIADKKKIGKMCLDVEAGPDGMLYAGVMDEKGISRICRISMDFTSVTPISSPVQGLNGMAQDRSGYLYIASSNLSFFNPKGCVLRAKIGDDNSFINPEVFIETGGITNGLAFSPDESKLYVTNLNGVLMAVDMKTREKKVLYSPGKLQIFDDLDTAADGTVWLCFNSEMAIISVKDGLVTAGYRTGDLKAPSSCKFGKGPGFRPDFLYITEFGMKGRSLKMNGRGVFVMPVPEIPE
ncbi:MAG TPA: SMP-30/gluconolactonase/LRE family protein [Desulfomonilia bacterium]